MKKNKYPKKTYVFSHGYDKDIAGGDLRERKIGGEYQYIKKSAARRFLDAVLYRLVATPIAFIYTKLFMHEKIIGKKKLRAARGVGYFLVGNHTQQVSDAFTPNMVSFPRRCYVIISTKNMSLPVIGPLTPSLGGMPLPSDMAAARNFSRAIRRRIDERAAVCIYPEGHVWDYFVGIRPFREGSLDIAARLGAPVFTFTRAYIKKWYGAASRIYIDGPFYADGALPKREAAAILTEQIRRTMENRAALSDVEVIKYIKEDEPTQSPEDTADGGEGAVASARPEENKE